MTVTVRLGFVPSYRFRWTEWTKQMRDESIVAMSQIPGVQVVVPQPSKGDVIDAVKGLTPYGAVSNLDQGETVAEYFQAQKVDALVLMPLDFGDERSAAKIAEKLGVPVLLVATKEPPAVDPIGMGRVSDSYCGNLSMASGLYRRKIAFHYAGIFFPTEPEFVAEVDTFARAAAVVKGLKNARIGQVGVRPPTFETVGYDEAAMASKFGQNVIYTNISDITNAALQLADDDAEVLATLAVIRASVPTITVSDKHLLAASKFEVALTRFYSMNRLSGMAVQCWPSIQGLMGISLCALYGRMTQKHMLTACETDVLGALAMITNYQAAMGANLPHFIDWTIQHRENPNWLLAWHCGNAPVSLAKDADAVALRSRRDMTGTQPIPEDDPQAGLVQFQLKPGKVTFCRLAEYDNQWKMLIATGDIIPSDETLAGTWSWVQVRDHAHLYRVLVEEGFIHHASMIHGDQVAALMQACKFLGITPVVVASNLAQPQYSAAE
jgi:L-fucose isomerase-like protein